MSQQLLAINQGFISALQALEAKNKKADSELNKAISVELEMAKVWNRAMEQVLASMQDESGD